MTGPTILVADDDEDDRLLIQDAFVECQIGDPLSFVNDGEELIAYLRRTGPYEKPRKDGATALQEIKNDEILRNIPVVILTTTGSDDAVDRIYIYGLGANSFITKPVTFEKLCEGVRVLSYYWTDIVAILPGCRKTSLSTG